MRKILTFLLVATLSACGGSNPSPGDAPAAQAAGADPAMVEVASAMQRTILEATAIGAGSGAAFNVVTGIGNRSDSIQVGALLGASAGTYVALVQRTYILKNRRLEAIQTDLDANAAEIERSIAVMRQVLEDRRAEIDSFSETPAAAAELETVVGDTVAARANLEEMERAIAGADGRFAEFEETRSLVLIDASTSEIDEDLANLQGQIATMRSIAGELAQSL